MDKQQPGTFGYRPNIDQSEPSASQPHPQGFASPLVKRTIPLDREPVSYDPREKDRIYSEDQSYRETVKGVRACMEWSFIPDREFTAQSRHDNLWTGTRSQPVGKISVAFPPEDWFCRKLEQMNFDGHMSHWGKGLVKN